MGKKIDLSQPNRQEEISMIDTYRQENRQEFPLRITKNLTILVPIEKCNEEYRQYYLKQKMR